MIRSRGRTAIQVAAVACAMLFTPVVTHSQTTDSTRTTYADTDNHRGGFNWGWLGLLGLLGLLPRKRKETVVTDNRPGGTGGTTGRY
ncbi:MAG: WGxxGxxG family protein [Gemmatimonadaceae bacterium]